MKGYIVGFESRASADHEIIDYWFSSSPNDAMRWQLRDLAESDVMLFNRGITINQEFQRPHTLTDFQIEAAEDGFMVWAEGPFVIRAAGEGRNRPGRTPASPSAPRT